MKAILGWLFGYRTELVRVSDDFVFPESSYHEDFYFNDAMTARMRSAYGN